MEAIELTVFGCVGELTEVAGRTVGAEKAVLESELELVDTCTLTEGYTGGGVGRHRQSL